MREIKFRAWSKSNKCMLKQSISVENHIGKTVWTNKNHSIIYDYDMILGEYCIPMQFTGLHDKNGKEIYTDSSIVKFKFLESLDKVVELVGVFTFNDDELRYEIDIYSNNSYTCLYYKGNGKMYDFEIIGTKQEHPELVA